jgi:anaerobic ribonucleoside-triphosphate reductase
LKLVHDFENYRDNIILSALKESDQANRKDKEFKLDQKTVERDRNIAQSNKVRKDIELAAQKRKYNDELIHLIR